MAKIEETAKDQTTKDQTTRRRVPRRPIKSHIGILVDGRYFLATGLEIGEGGILVETDVQLQEGKRVVITFRIPGVMQGVMLGKIVYELEAKKSDLLNRYGVQFEKVDFEVKRKIRNFVAANSSVQNTA